MEWFAVEDLFLINGDQTTYKQTIKERNLWIETRIQMAMTHL